MKMQRTLGFVVGADLAGPVVVTSAGAKKSIHVGNRSNGLQPSPSSARLVAAQPSSAQTKSARAMAMDFIAVHGDNDGRSSGKECKDGELRNAGT